MSRLDTQAFETVVGGGLGDVVGVVVMPLAVGVAEPGEAGEALAFGEHVGGDFGLAAGEGVDEEFALEFGDAGPIFHVAFGFRADRCALIVGWEAGDSAFDVADGGQVFVDARRILFAEGVDWRRGWRLPGRCRERFFCG
jgi:hypothetical protein